MTIEDNSQRLQ